MHTPRETLDPLTIESLLRQTSKLYRHNVLLFTMVTAACYMPILIIDLTGQAITLTGPDSTVSYWVAPILESLGGWLSIVALTVANGAIVRVVSRQLLGKPFGFRAAYSGVNRWGMTLTVAVILSAIISIGGLVLLIIPGVIMFLGFSFVPQAVVIENCSAFQSLDRSLKRTKGNRLNLFIVWVNYFIITTGLIMFVDFLLAVAIDPKSHLFAIVFSLLTTLIHLIIVPLITIVITLLYYDFRVRQEGMRVV